MKFDAPTVATVPQMFGVIDYLLAENEREHLSAADVVQALYEWRAHYDNQAS